MVGGCERGEFEDGWVWVDRWVWVGKWVSLKMGGFGWISLWVGG